MGPGSADARGSCSSKELQWGFGVDFFSDAGNVAGHAVLFFTLESDASAASGVKGGHQTLVPFRKTCEQLSLAAGGVAYSDCTLGWERSCSAASAAAGGAAELCQWLRGKWRNESAGT